MGQPWPLFHLFLSFQTNIKFLQQIKVKKCPSSIRCQGSNSWPLEHESPPITTRRGLPPSTSFLCFFISQWYLYVESHRFCNRVQDAYTLRCCPQVHGIVHDTIDFVRGIITTEMNSATDNPVNIEDLAFQ